MATQATQISTPSIPLDIIMVLSRTQTTDIQMAFGGNKATDISIDLSCSRATYLDMVLGSSASLEITMGSGGYTGSTFLHSVVFLSLSHLSTVPLCSYHSPISPPHTSSSPSLIMVAPKLGSWVSSFLLSQASLAGQALGCLSANHHGLVGLGLVLECLSSGCPGWVVCLFV